MKTVFVLILLFSILLGVGVGVVFQSSLSVPIDESIALTKHMSQFIKGIHDHKFALLNSADNSALNLKYLGDGSDVRFVKTQAELEKKYGSGANLDNDETRDLYHQVLDDTEASQNKWINMPTRDRSPGAIDADEHEAMMCSVARGRVRQYARSRMSDQRSALMLNVRDAWTHGLRYLPQAIYQDVTRYFSGWLNSKKPTTVGGMMPTEDELLQLPKEEGEGQRGGGDATLDRGAITPNRYSSTSAALASASSCLSGDEGAQCPGIHLSRFVKGRSNKEIRDGCFRTSKSFDKLYGNNKQKGGGDNKKADEL